MTVSDADMMGAILDELRRTGPVSPDAEARLEAEFYGGDYDYEPTGNTGLDLYGTDYDAWLDSDPFPGAERAEFEEVAF